MRLLTCQSAAVPPPSYHSATRNIVSVRSACRQPFGARVTAYRVEADGRFARAIFVHDRRPRGAGA